MNFEAIPPDKNIPQTLMIMHKSFVKHRYDVYAYFCSYHNVLATSNKSGPIYLGTDLQFQESLK